MKIKARTRYNTIVTIVGFVSRYDTTYAVCVGHNGKLCEFELDRLTVIDDL